MSQNTISLYEVNYDLIQKLSLQELQEIFKDWPVNIESTVEAVELLEMITKVLLF